MIWQHFVLDDALDAFRTQLEDEVDDLGCSLHGWVQYTGSSRPTLRTRISSRRPRKSTRCSGRKEGTTAPHTPGLHLRGNLPPTGPSHAVPAGCVAHYSPVSPAAMALVQRLGRVLQIRRYSVRHRHDAESGARSPGGTESPPRPCSRHKTGYG